MHAAMCEYLVGKHGGVAREHPTPAEFDDESSDEDGGMYKIGGCTKYDLKFMLQGIL